MKDKPKPRVRLKRTQARKRVTGLWFPKWEPEIAGYTRNLLNKRKLTTDILNEQEDMMQDGYCLFLKLCHNYPRIVSPKQFMALYKTSLNNLIVTRLKREQRTNALFSFGVDIDELLVIGELPNSGELLHTISRGPEELLMFLNVFNNNKALEKLREKSKIGEPRKNLNTKVAEILGIPSYPFLQVLKKLLS